MLDTQAGYEKGVTAVLAAQAGATFVCEAAGTAGEPPGNLPRGAGRR